MVVDCLYLSTPTPAATPNRIRLLLIVARKELVLRSRSLSCRVSIGVPLPTTEVMVVLGSPRWMKLTDTPGTSSDSCRRPTRRPPPNLVLVAGATLMPLGLTVGT